MSRGREHSRLKGRGGDQDTVGNEEKAKELRMALRFKGV